MEAESARPAGDAESARPAGAPLGQAPAHVGPFNGPAMAAVLAAGIGLFVLALAHVQGARDADFNERLVEVGDAWIPHADHIGPYSGKETLSLVAWLASWGIMHVSMQRRDIDVRKWTWVFLALIFVAVLLLWPPVTHWVVDAT